MTFPPGYPGPTDFVLLLLKSIYGLKQAGRNWWNSLRDALVSLDFIQLLSDACVFIHRSKLVFISMHVDDIVIYSGSKAICTKIVTELCRIFSMKPMGVLSYYIGFEITRSPGRSTIHQTSYVERVLSRFSMDGAKSTSMPAPEKVQLSKSQSPLPDDADANARAKIRPFRSAVGSLLYAALGSRPDIMHAVISLAQFNANHGDEHWTAVKHCFRYLVGTKSCGLTYTSTPGDTVNITAYCDSDWAGDPDTRKSRSGGVIILADNPVIWISKTQATIALSSCEAEFVALCETIKEIVWLLHFLKELNIPHNNPIPLYIDNKAALALSQDPVNHRSSKHIDLKFKFICATVEAGKVEPIYIPTADNIADLFTKSTSIAVFRKLIGKLVSDTKQ